MPLAAIRASLRGTFIHRLYRLVSPVRVLNLCRRAKDRLRTLADPSLRGLHRRLRDVLRDQAANWPHYRYDFGYFYQGYDRIRISGVRPTERRVEAYRLDAYLNADAQVLDVGANAGFLSIEAARRAAHVDAVEFNPYLVKIGRMVAEWTDVKNVRFHAADFLAFQPDRIYHVVLSFANHFTDDGNMRPQLRPYLERLHGLLADRGLLLFESHSTDIADPAFHAVMDGLDGLFERLDKRLLSNGLRRGGDRIYYVLRKK